MREGVGESAASVPSALAASPAEGEDPQPGRMNAADDRRDPSLWSATAFEERES